MARTFSMIVGLAFITAGLLGFIPGAHMHPAVEGPLLRVPSGYGYLFGLFPVNVLHDLVHLAVGALGVLAAGREYNAIVFSRALAVFYGVLAVMGVFPVLDTMFGLIPIFGHDVWLHAGTAAVAAYFGWSARSQAAAIVIETAPVAGRPPVDRPTGTSDVR